MSSKRDKMDVLKLNLLDAPRTWFHWNGNKYNVSEASASVFDAWIRKYVEEIDDVDIVSWEIFQRWDIINTVVKGGLLILKKQADGSQILEDVSSALEAEMEGKTSCEVSSEAV